MVSRLPTRIVDAMMYIIPNIHGIHAIQCVVVTTDGAVLDKQINTVR